MVLDLDVKESTTYEEASKYLLNKINLDCIQNFSYSNFINNVIKRYMNRVYDRGFFKVKFDSWWIDTAETLPVSICKAKFKSYEVALKAVITITFTDEFRVRRDTKLPSNSMTFEITLTKFPCLTPKGDFIINGVDKILISHLGKANKIFLRSPDKKNKKQKGQVELCASTGSILTMDKTINFKNVNIGRAGTKSHVFDYIKALEELGYVNTDSIIDIVGVNAFFLDKINSTTLSFSNDKSSSILSVINHFQLTVEDRQNINKRLHFARNITNKRLSSPTAFEYNKEKYSFPAGHKITYEDAKLLQNAGISSIQVTDKGITVPVYNNGFVDAKELFKSYNLPVPDEFIVKSRNPLEEDQFVEYYLACNKQELDDIIREFGPMGEEILTTQIKLNMDRLLGTCLTKNDIVAMINMYSRFLLHIEEADDIDSLENKKIINISDIYEKGLAEAIGVPSRYNQKILPTSLLSRIESELRSIKNNSTSNDTPLEKMLRINLNLDCNAQTITSGTGKISLFNIEDSTNPLSQINHKRKITLQYISDFGGISTKAPNTDARQNNPSYSGRIDCVETPEGQSVGLVRETATLAFLNEFGQLEAPFFKVDHEHKVIDLTKVYYMQYDEEILYNRALSPAIAKETGIKIIYYDKKSDVVTTDFFATSSIDISIKPYEKIAKAKIKEDKSVVSYRIEKHKRNWFIDDHLTIMSGHNKPFNGRPEDVDFISCSGEHIFSPVTSAIPFIEFDDAARGMMGSVMSKQAVPVVAKQKQYVRTEVAQIITPTATGVITAPYDLEVLEVDATHIRVRNFETGEEEDLWCLRQDKTSKKTLNKSIPIVTVGELKFKGDILADNTATLDGELAHGTHLNMVITSLDGVNYEDGVILSERLVMEDIYTSIHLVTYELKMTADQVVKNKLDIIEGYNSKSRRHYNVPSFNPAILNSDHYTNAAVIRQGTLVKPNDVLACKVVPDLKKNSKMVNNSGVEEYNVVPLRYTGNVPGTVVGVDTYKVSDSEIMCSVKVAKKMKVGVGDKYTGRHGNKGITCGIYAIEDMPYDAETGERADIVVNLLGIPSRMNIGQLFDGHLGKLCHDAHIRVIVKTLSNINVDYIKKAIKLGNVHTRQLCDGRTGKKLRYTTSVTLPYCEKLEHMVSNKIDARTCKPYTTRRQPTQGKALNGGQRLGEMEFWSLFAHGAVNVCRELTMFKTDDVDNRKAFLEMTNSNEQDWEKVTSRRQNVSYALLRTDAYYKSMFFKMRYYDADNNEIDITGSANNTKPGCGRNYLDNLNKAKEEYKTITKQNVSKVNIDSLEEEDDDEDYTDIRAIAKTQEDAQIIQSITKTTKKYEYIPVDYSSIDDDEGLDDDSEDEIELNTELIKDDEDPEDEEVIEGENVIDDAF